MATSPPDSTSLKKRSVTIAGHRTSVSLEDAFWKALKKIAAEKGTSTMALIEAVDKNRTGNLSSALRVFILREVVK